MTSNDVSTAKLLITAAGAAVAGATISFALTQYFASKQRMSNDSHGNYDPTGARRYHRTSYIYEAGTSESAPNSIVFPHNHEEKMRRLVAARAAVEEDNSLPRQSVTVRVPATSANLGPGCKFLSIYCGEERMESQSLPIFGWFFVRPVHISSRCVLYVTLHNARQPAYTTF